MSTAVASEAPSSVSGNPVEGVKKAHVRFLYILRLKRFSSLYKSFGPLADEQLKKLDQAGVKRENSLILRWLAFRFTIRSKNGGEALNLLLYWVMFGFFALLDSSAICLLPTYFFLKTLFLVFLFLPQTQGAVLIYQKVVDPIARAVEGIVKKK
ncbi:unnamed protein product [Angiostrongylus costaricensis]|uniref:Receptor expression-enhancing protein n=1 Tax=Angiostrongylus costaricensis TaxID=334426 RepID=A0A0R3PFX6_ANGCS|nr:unnamed protein product [Angiostrongylus costaricensis]